MARSVDIIDGRGVASRYEVVTGGFRFVDRLKRFQIRIILDAESDCTFTHVDMKIVEGGCRCKAVSRNVREVGSDLCIANIDVVRRVP